MLHHHGIKKLNLQGQNPFVPCMSKMFSLGIGEYLSVYH
jgi:hypothetical protein